MKAVFIDPSGTVKGLNVGLGYLASVLSKENVSVNVVDVNNNPLNPIERIKKEIKDANFVGISIKSFTLRESLEIINQISNLIRNKTLICGGSHISLDGVNFLKQNEIFKIGVVGEAEETIKEIKKYVYEDTELNKIKGIVYRKENKVIETSPREPITELDKLPFPEYEHFDSFEGTIIGYPLITSRGCPYSCIYCSVGRIIGKKWRARTPKNVIMEVLHAKDKYKIKRFSILDDNFTLDISRAKEICQLLIDNKANLKWSCPNGIRADRLDEELIRLMKEAGCYQVSIGVESVDDKVFKNIKKGEELSDIENAIKLCKKVGLDVCGFFIVGLPFDNKETIKKSVEFVKRLGIRADWSMFSPYPKTDAWEWVNSHAKILKDWTEGFHFGSNIDTIFETNNFSRKDRIDAYYYACLNTNSYEQFYDNNKSMLSNSTNILKIIWKYDKRHFHKHLLTLFKKFIKYAPSNKITRKV